VHNRFILQPFLVQVLSFDILVIRIYDKLANDKIMDLPKHFCGKEEIRFTL